MKKPCMLSEMDLYRIFCSWRQGSGPFRCFVRSTNFVTLKHYEDFPLIEPAGDKKPESIVALLTGPYRHVPVIIIDLPGLEALQCAFYFQKKLSIKPIITFNNILHPHGLVGGRADISALLLYGERLKPFEPARFAFILDSNRFAEYDEKEYRLHFNNQYELTDDDLPSLEMLRVLHHEEILCIHRGELKEDLISYLEYLKDQEIKVVIEKIQGGA